MVKYLCIRENNPYRGSWLIFIPYEDNLQNMVKIEILRTVMNNILSIDDESDFMLRELSYTLEEIEIAKTIMDDTFDCYFDPINILEINNLSNLITTFILLYYELLEVQKKDPYFVHIDETKAYSLVRKGRIMEL